MTIRVCVVEDDRRYRESLELLGINGDGALIDARFTWDNAGMLAGRSETTFDWIHRKSEPIHYGRKSLPDTAARSAVLRRSRCWLLT